MGQSARCANCRAAPTRNANNAACHGHPTGLCGRSITPINGLPATRPTRRAPVHKEYTMACLLLLLQPEYGAIACAVVTGRRARPLVLERHWVLACPSGAEVVDDRGRSIEFPHRIGAYIDLVGKRPSTPRRRRRTVLISGGISPQASSIWRRCGSPQQLAQPDGAIGRGRLRPAQAGRSGASTQIDADVRCGRFGHHSATGTKCCAAISPRIFAGLRHPASRGSDARGWRSGRAPGQLPPPRRPAARIRRSRGP